MINSKIFMKVKAFVRYEWTQTTKINTKILSLQGAFMQQNRFAACFLLALAILPGSTVFSQASTIRSSNGAISVSPNSGGYTVNFVLPEYKYVTINESTNSYDEITVPEFGTSSTVGQPKLPQISFNIWIPNVTSVVSVQEISKSEKNETLAKKIYPVQLPWPKSRPISERPFSMDQGYYNSSGSKLDVDYSVSAPFVIAGVSGVTITLYPFKYSPIEDILYTIQNLNMSIVIQNTSKAVTPPVNQISSFNDVFKSFFINYADLPHSSDETKAVGGTGNYLIITDPTYSATMNSFVTFRQSKGSTVNMFTTTTTGRSTDSIKQFIQNRYNELSIRPEFILLVGDIASIPAWPSTNEDHPWNDLYYGTLEGDDYFPDAHVGRFSVSSTAELSNIINKTIDASNKAELVQPKKAAFMASRDRYTITEGTHNYVIDKYFAPKGYNTTKRYCHTYNATTDEVISDINGGQEFCIYSGHSSSSGWSDGPAFSQDNVRNLTNTQYPFVYSFSCQSNDYSVDECFAETWIRQSKGAASYWGSSVFSYWDEDDVLERALIKSIYENGINEICPSFNAAKMALYTYYADPAHIGSYTRNNSERYFEQYNLLGDPALIVYKKIINVSYLGVDKFKIVDGSVLIDGTELTGTPSGLVFSMLAGITINGDLTRPQSVANQATWLYTESNLNGGLIFRTNDNNETQFHISNTGVMRVSKTINNF